MYRVIVNCEKIYNLRKFIASVLFSFLFHMQNQKSMDKGYWATYLKQLKKLIPKLFLRFQSAFCSLLLTVFKNIILKSFNEIVLVFLSVESKANILYVNINFTENVYFEFGKYCDKVVPEPAVSHTFWAPALTKNVLLILFLTLTQ